MMESKASFGAQGEISERWHQDDPMWPQDSQQVCETIDEIISMKRMGDPVATLDEDLRLYKEYYRNPLNYGERRDCYAGVKSLIIDHQGGVRLCFTMPKIGNLREQPLDELWRSHEAKARRAIIRTCGESCSLLACNRKNSLSSQVRPFIAKMSV